MLDRVELKVKAGDGGRGAVSFRREKYVPYGGPFGGDGGKGGDVIIRADESVSTLRAYKHKRSFKADNGKAGMTKNKHGSDAAILYLTVPPGTLVYRINQADSAELMADLEKSGQQVVVARGGNGGFGNTHFATATNQTPRIAQPGIKGQEYVIVLELRLIADAGIIGYPNVGKSSLLAALSAASPRIADYPFTTLEPELGVVEAGGERFILAEIPGLIQGAHSGKGLGHNFLRHAMRTRVFIHLLDGTSVSPLDDMIKVNNEISMFDTSLASRPQVVAINKIDVPSVKNRISDLTREFKEASIKPVFISASSREGLEELVDAASELLKDARKIVQEPVITPIRVFRPRPVPAASGKRIKGNTYIVSDPELDHLLDKFDPENSEDWPEFYELLERLEINALLRSAGAKSGDTVVSGNREWKWYTDEYRRNGRNL